MAETKTPEALIEVDATRSLIEKKIASDNSFIVEEYNSPRVIQLKGFNKPLNLVSVLEYTNFVRQGQSIDKSPGLDEFAKETQGALKSILKPGDKISLQTMPDSYYYDDKAIRSYNERDVDVIAYIGDKPLQEILVDKGIVIYNNNEAFRLDDIYLAKGEVDRTLAEVLKSAEIIAASKKQGFWQDKYGFYEFKSRAIGQLNKTFEGNRELLEEKVKQINQAKLNRTKSTKSAEERKKEVIAQRQREKEALNRTYSSSSLGEQLGYLAKQYFPRQKSGDIVSGIVSGIYPKSAMQIGALWSGIPTLEEEKNGLGAASHPVEIVEIRKDGDVKPILGQGFLSMMMGNRPPDEGLTLVFTCSTRGIESFIAPLVTQFRMDPIVPIRNLHVARFARPIFSNREFYSKVFGKLPKDITELVNPDGSYTVQDEGSVRELSRLLDYMYLSVPIYIAVRRVQVNNLENNSGSYTVTIECQITDVSENFGEYPTYFSTIDDAFQVHEKRASVIDKANTESAIKYIAEQIGSSNLTEIYTKEKSSIEEKEEPVESKVNYIKEHMPSLFSGDSSGSLKSEDGEPIKGSKIIGYILREGKLVEVPQYVTLQDATLQAQGAFNQKYASVKDVKNKVGRFLSYKPAFGNAQSWTLAKRLLGLSDVKFSDSDTMKELYRYFSVYKELPSKMPIPIGGNSRIRNGFVYKDDLVPTGASLLSALRAERNSLIDNTYISSSDAISGLFAVTNAQSSFNYYDYAFSNFRKEGLIGSSFLPVIKPFELCAVTNTSFGENTLANLMEFEYGIGLGLGCVKVDLESNSLLKLTPLEEPYSLVGSLKNVSQSLTVFEFSESGTLPTSTIANLIASFSNSKTSFLGELNATFGYSLTSRLIDGAGNKLKLEGPLEGILGSIKFHTSNYKTLVSTKFQGRKLTIGNSTQERNLITNRYEYWKQERVDHVIGSEVKAPLKFEISLRNNNKTEKVTVGLTNILRSSVGNTLFTLQVEDKEKTILALRTVKYEDKLIDLVKRYIEGYYSYTASDIQTELGSLTGDIARTSLSGQNSKGPISPSQKESFEEIKYSIRNIIQSIVSKSTRDPLVSKSSPTALSDVTQVISVTKSKNGTRYLDESEPYVFSLMYQLGRVQPGKFNMTFKMRPDRVPYVRPDFLLTDVTTMEMEIFRPEAPKEESRIDAYTRELQRNENAVKRTSTKEGLDTEVAQFALAVIQETDKTVNVGDVKSVEQALKKPVYVVGAIQALLLRYLDYVYSAHIVSKAGQTLLQKNLKIVNPKDKDKSSTGLNDFTVAELLKDIKNDIIENKISAINKKVKQITDKNPSAVNENKIIEANIRSLLRIISEVDSRISDAKNTKGEPFVSVENIKRVVRYAQIRGIGDVFLDTKTMLDEIFRTYELTIDLLINPTKMQKLYKIKSAEIELGSGDTSIGRDLLNLSTRLNSLLNITQAIRLASGDSLDFVKRKKLTLKKPIPSIGIVEEYGISSPIKAPGKKKATYQVVGSAATTAYIQFRTNISELYISETSKLADLVNEEEGMDAIYNMIREPNDVTTIYNMMRSGRALVRDASVFTQGSTTSSRTGAGLQSIENAFRLVRRASINSAQADAASVLVGLSEPHVQIKEPLFMALGLSKFVAKTTKLSSATDTTSWKVDVFLLPYEAGYTTNRNLKKVNKGVSNETVGDIASWLNAADSIFAERFITSEGKSLKETLAQKGQDYGFALRRAESLIRISKMATAAVFSNIVAVHAIYKAKQKIFSGLEPETLIRPKDFKTITAATDSLSKKDLDRMSASLLSKQKAGFNELDLSPSSFVSTVNYGGVGQTTYFPIGLESPTGAGITESISTGTALGAAGISIAPWAFKKVGLGKASSFVEGFNNKSLIKFSKVNLKAVPILSAVSTAADILTSAFKTQLFGEKDTVISSSERLAQNLNNNMNVVLALSQDFSLYALDFLEDFAAAESRGLGKAFIELIAREAESVIQNAGEVSGVGVLAYSESSDESSTTLKVPTAMGYILSTYPISSLFRDLRPEEYFESETGDSKEPTKVERITIAIVNSNAFGTSGEVSSLFGGKKWEKTYKDFYPDKKGDGSFFGSYTSSFSENTSPDKRSVQKTDIDTCGEELLSLIIDGQVAMYDTDIYSIALAPKYILADTSFYYEGIRSVWGRLKVNHFATHLLSTHYAGTIANRLSVFSKNTSRDRNTDKLVKDIETIGISISNFSLKKTADYKKISSFVDKLFSNKQEASNTLSSLAEFFPLANGKQIFSRSLEIYKVYEDAVRSYSTNGSSASINSRVFKNIELVQGSITEIISKILQEIPVEKRSRLKPVTPLYSVSSINLSETERQDLLPTYQIASSVSGLPSQSVSGETLKETSLSNVKFLLEKVKQNLKEQVSWLIDSYTILLDGVKKSDFTFSDSVASLRESILTQLATTRALELGITFEQAKEEYINQINSFFNSSQGAVAIDQETLDNIQKACDEITLYSTGNKSGRDVILREYVSFVSTFKSLMRQKITLKGNDGFSYDSYLLDKNKKLEATTISSGSRISGVNTSLYSSNYKEKSKDSVWDVEEYDIFNSFYEALYQGSNTRNLQTAITSLGILLTEIRKSLGTVKNSKKYLRYSTLSFIDMNDKEMTKVLNLAYTYFTVQYGIERPEYIPSIFYCFDFKDAPDGNLKGLVRTDITRDMLSHYSMGYKRSFGVRLGAFFTYLFIGNDIPFSIGSFIHLAFFALGVGLAFIAAPLVAIVVAILIIVIGIVIMFAVSPSVDNYQIASSFMSSLRAKIPNTNIATTPLLTGMKALLEIATTISEMDIIPVGTYALSGKNLIKGVSRSGVFVYPPNLSLSIINSEYILQDTLSYLTLPLITKGSVNSVLDVLSPGGYVIPSMERVNENAKLLSTSLLVQESFCRDELESFPDYLAIQKAKAQNLSADKLANNPLEPKDPSNVNTGYFESFKRFTDNMQGIFIGTYSTENVAGKVVPKVTSDFQSRQLRPSSSDEIGAIYRYLLPSLIPYTKFDKPDSLGRFYSKTVVPSQKFQQDIRENIDSGAASFLTSMFDVKSYRPSNIDFSKESISRVSSTNKLIIEFKAQLFSISEMTKKSPVSRELAYALFVNSVEFVNVVLRSNNEVETSKKNILNHKDMASLSYIKKQIEKPENPSFTFMVWPDVTSGTTVPGSMYLKALGKKVLIEGLVRGSSGLNFSKTDIAFVYETSSSARNANRINSTAVKDEGIIVQLSSSFSFFGEKKTPAVAVISRTKDLESNNLLTNRWNHIFLERFERVKQESLALEGEVFLRAAEAISKFIGDSEKPYFTIDISKEINPDRKEPICFTELYAIKLAYERHQNQAAPLSFSEESAQPGNPPVFSPLPDILIVTWRDIINALKDIGGYFRFIAYAVRESATLAGLEISNTTIAYNRDNKPLILKNVTSTSDLKNSNTSNSKSVNTVFAATAGLASQFVIDKLEKYLDSNSNMVWETAGKLTREVRNVLMSPMKLYPVAKLYFVKKTKSETVLYDDLFSYADILSVKVFESSKTPGSTIIIKLANTENKIDNIITARSNSLNPFETRAKNEDDLSGLIMKSGMRIIVYLGYGNILTEEEKFLAEIETSQQEPDGTYTIYARGPGWVLNNRMNQSTGRDSSNKVITIDYREVNQVLPIASETDIEVTETSNPAVPVAKNLLLYGLIEKGKLDRFGRLGSITNELSETIMSSLPLNITDQYTSLLQKGIGVSTTDFGAQAISNLEGIAENLKNALAGTTFVSDSPALYLQKSAQGDAKVIRKTSVARNIFPNSGFPVTTGLWDTLAIWLRDVPLVPQSNGNVWKVIYESYIEFIQEVILNVPNVRTFVRSFNNDGSLIIGQVDEFYSMYTPKTLSSKLSDNIRNQLLLYKNTKLKNSNVTTLTPLGVVDTIETKRSEIQRLYGKTPEQLLAEGREEVAIGPIGSVKLRELVKGQNLDNTDSLQNIYKSLYKMMRDSFTSEAAREAVAQILSATLTALAVGEFDDANVSEIVRAMDNGSSINILTSRSTEAAVEIYNQLKSAQNIAIFLDAVIGEYTSGNNLSDVQRSALQRYDEILDSESELNSSFSQQGILQRLEIIFLGINRILSIQKARENLEVALQIGWSTKISADQVAEAIKNTGGNAGFVGDSDGESSYAFFRRFVFCLTASCARFFNNKLLKLELLAPEKRKIQEDHYMFSGRDIIHNDIATMAGYNEGEFVFEKTGSINTSFDSLNNVIGLFNKLERFPFYVDPVSAYEGNSFDYVAKRMFVNLANPTFFAYTINASGQDTNITSALTLMAANQMCKLIQDWYGGYIYTFGDSTRRPSDVVHLTDDIRDMYGPFEIKESIYSFDIDGFTSSYSPSVLTQVDPRNITDQSSYTVASQIFGLLASGALAIGAFKSRKAIANFIRAIPGVPKTLSKVNSSLAKTSANSKWGGKLAGAISKIIVTPLLKTTKYATRDLKRNATRFASKSKQKTAKSAVDSYFVGRGLEDFNMYKVEISPMLREFDSYLVRLQNIDIPDPQKAVAIENVLSFFKNTVKKFPDIGTTPESINSIDDVRNLVASLKKVTSEDPKRIKGLIEFIETTSLDFRESKNSVQKLLELANQTPDAQVDEIKKLVALYGDSPEMLKILGYADDILANPQKSISYVSKYSEEIGDVLVGLYVNQTGDSLSQVAKHLNSGGFPSTPEYRKLSIWHDKYFRKDTINSTESREALDSLSAKAQEIFEAYGPADVEKAKDAVYKLFSDIRKSASGVDVKIAVNGVSDFKVTDGVKGFFREATEAIDDIAESSHGKILTMFDNIDSDSIIANGFDVLTADPNLVKKLDDLASEATERIVKDVSTYNKEISKYNTELKRLKELKKENRPVDYAAKLEAEKEKINLAEKKVQELQEEIRRIEANKHSPQNIKLVSDIFKDSKSALSSPETKGFYKDQVSGQTMEMVDDLLFARAFATADGKVDGTSFNNIKKSLFIPKQATYSRPNVTPGAGLLKASFKAFTFYGTYAYIRDTVGESIQEFMFRLASQEASDSVITHFMVYKGEPFLSNMEGLTKGSSRLLSKNADYGDYLISRFNSLGRDFQTIMTSVYGETVRSNLTQYTDLIAQTTISDEYFLPFDSEYKFSTKDSSSGSASDGNVSGLNDKPSSFFNGPVYLRYAYGWRYIEGNGNVDFHDGVDLLGANPATRGKEAIIKSNKVYAVEDGIVFFNFFKGTFNEFDGALSKPEPYTDGPFLKSPAVSITLIGLKTGLIFDYIHCYPLLDGQEFNAATQAANTSDIYYVGSGTNLGFHGPFGFSIGPHLHLDIYQSPDGPRNKFISDLNKAVGQSNPGKINSNAEVLKLVKSLGTADRAPSKGFAKVDPEPIIKGIPIPGYLGADQAFVKAKISLQVELKNSGIINKNQKAAAVDFYKSKGKVIK